jgi:tryptophan-rich sensory protein
MRGVIALVSPTGCIFLFDTNDTEQKPGASLSSRVIVFGFSLCALLDFAWSMFQGRSVVASVIRAILGLFGTGWYLLTMWASSHNNPDDLNEPARWVP